MLLTTTKENFSRLFWPNGIILVTTQEDCEVVQKISCWVTYIKIHSQWIHSVLEKHWHNWLLESSYPMFDFTKGRKQQRKGSHNNRRKMKKKKPPWVVQKGRKSSGYEDALESMYVMKKLYGKKRTLRKIKIKKVTTFCLGCQKEAFLCLTCFNTLYRIIRYL